MLHPPGLSHRYFSPAPGDMEADLSCNATFLLALLHVGCSEAAKKQSPRIRAVHVAEKVAILNVVDEALGGSKNLGITFLEPIGPF